MENKGADDVSCEVSPVRRMPSPTLPLMERINAILGKRSEAVSTNDQSRGFETETDSDGSSDMDQHESLPKFIEEHKKYNYITEKFSKKSESVDCVLESVLPDSIQHTSKTERIAISLLPDDISGDDPNINDIEFPLPSTRTQLYSKICNNFKKQNIKEMNFCEVTKPSLTVEEDLEKPINANVSAENRIAKDAGKELKRKTKESAKIAKETAKEEEKRRRLEEKEEKKRKQEQDKNAKRAESMTAKANSIDQCLKHITTVLDSTVLSDGGSAILQALETAGVQFEVKRMPVDSSIGWMRNQVEYTAEENGQIKRKDSYEEEDQVLMKIKAESLAEMIDVEKKSGNERSGNGILSCVSNAEILLPGKKITIIFTGLETYLKIVKAKSTLKRKQPSMPCITKTDLEDTLLQLQLQYNCCVHFCEQAEDFAQFVCAFTKSIAERPHKKTSGVAFDVYMNSHEKGLPREYQRASSELGASLLLQDIEVRRGHGVLATSRRVGPELSKKIYTLLMSICGTAELAKS
ncbi:crossover junction endonuclease EME1-like isoform X2 [Rhopilema esculentum]|uniref:crossover junction endonuclease EME1-like isoform X2 n=1 Tax=Rhopilema esculentum TaxID=499914 RepID=UPI0031D02C88